MISQIISDIDVTIRHSSLQWRHNGLDGVSNYHLTIVYSTVYSDVDQRKHQSSASQAFVQEFTGDRWIPRTNDE